MGCLISSQHTVARDQLLVHLRHPSVRAFLDTIAYAEGTLHENGYRTIFGHILFKKYTWHPRLIVCANYNNKQLCSSAAGKYQFSQKIWTKVAGIIKAKDFSPLNQERAAVYLLIDAGALCHVKSGDIDLAFEKVNTIWASLPGSPHKQPTKHKRVLHQVFKQQLHFHWKKGFRGGIAV